MFLNVHYLIFYMNILQRCILIYLREVMSSMNTIEFFFLFNKNVILCLL